MTKSRPMWCLIESDPDVFTAIIEEFGVKGLDVIELFGLEEKDLNSLNGVHGFVFLFKWDQTVKQNEVGFKGDCFFAKQMIENACATQAILSILFNSPGIELGPLSEFKSFAEDFTAEMKGEAISEYPLFMNVHNSFAQKVLLFDESPEQTSQEAFHFVSFLPINGKLCEFDGLKEFPVLHGDCTEDTWRSLTARILKNRVSQASGELRFNLMAIVRKRLDILHQNLNEAQEDPYITTEIYSQIQEEQDRVSQRIQDNNRRRHNYVPLLLETLKILSKSDQ